VTDTPPSVTPRFSELFLRVVFGLLMAAVALAIAVAGDSLFALFWTVAAVAVFREWLALMGVAKNRALLLWLIGSVGIVFAGALAEWSQSLDPASLWPALAASVFVALFAPSGRRLWVGGGVLYAAVIAIVPTDLRGDVAHGLVAILWLFAVVWLSDVVAYFTGRTFGGPKLWPAISPKKTWSGAIGGFVGGVAGALLVVHFMASLFGFGWYRGPVLIGVTMVAAIISQAGDLSESALKRHFGVKDSGHLIPGHGGVMDRLDSFWAVALFLYLSVLVIGPPQ
jgi:phosphatidate cytidylyltransferase